MKIATLIATIALALSPGLAAAMCSGHPVKMTCADGQVFDDETRSCVPVTTS